MPTGVQRRDPRAHSGPRTLTLGARAAQIGAGDVRVTQEIYIHIADNLYRESIDRLRQAVQRGRAVFRGRAYLSHTANRCRRSHSDGVIVD